MNEERIETLSSNDHDDADLPLIVEEETASFDDRPNTCRFCAGSQFC